jgi:hypothetical protein
MTLDVDLPITTTLEIKNNGLLLTIIEENRDDNKEYFINFKQNKISSEHPFALQSIVNIVKRLYYDNYNESFKIEARCYSCNNFRYWSKNMIYNESTKRLKDIGVSGERFQLHELSGTNDKISYKISSDYRKMETKIYVSRPNINKKPFVINVPFMSFKNMNFNNKEKILTKIKNMVLLAQ